MVSRDEKLADLALEVEAGLELVGSTAIEDKLQVGGWWDSGARPHAVVVLL